jgi:hypothetical protein
MVLSIVMTAPLKPNQDRAGLAASSVHLVDYIAHPGRSIM